MFIIAKQKVGERRKTSLCSSVPADLWDRFSNQVYGEPKLPKSYLSYLVLAHLVKVVSNNLPDPGPLQPDATHVVVGDLHNLLQAEHTWVCGRGQLIHGHGAQPAHEIN